MSLDCNASDIFCMLMAWFVQSKRLWNKTISIVPGKYFKVDNMKKTGLNRLVYNFSLNYDTVDTSNIVGIHRYLIKKHDIV